MTYDEEKEMAHRVKWVKRAVHYCRIIKRAIPQGSTALAMKAECRLLEYLSMLPTTTVKKALQLVSKWPWSLSEWEIPTCHSVCSILNQRYGPRFMK